MAQPLRKKPISETGVVYSPLLQAGSTAQEKLKTNFYQFDDQTKAD